MTTKLSFGKKSEVLASKLIDAAGNTLTLIITFLLVLIWGISGFYYKFSDHWEMIISTASSVVTILMVFLIQKSQNKDSLAIQLKLNELVAANEQASNRLVNAEGMSEEELKIINKYYTRLSDFAKKQENLQQSLSIDEANQEHRIKNEMEDELSKFTRTDET